jgi:hypothetical protein
MGVGSPPPPRRRRRGGCFGCLFVIVLMLVLSGAGVFLLAQAANAGAPAPASVVIFAQTVQSRHGGGAYNAATSGQVLAAGDSLRTVNLGRAAIQFSDGSLTRLAPNSEVTIDEAQLQRSGALKQVTLTQRAGRTLSTVQRLASGGGFKVNGRSTSAEVRGTVFEVYAVADGSVVYKLFQGKLLVSASGSTTLSSGQQVTVNPHNQIGRVSAIANDPTDPFTIELQAENGAATGTTPGTMASTAPAANLGPGASATSTYYSGGGDLVASLGYPGSLMRLCVTPPGRAAVCGQGASPVRVTYPSGDPGPYVLTVTALQVPAAGEPYFLSVGTRPPCSAGSVDSNGVIREALSASQLVQSIKVSGLGDVSAGVSSTSPSSAVISGSASLQGFSASGTIVVYAAPPNIGIVVTTATINGVGIPPAQAERFSQQSLSSIPLGFDVDRVYSCGNDVVVIEGHHQA